MTVIASIVDNGDIWMASDQQSTGSGIKMLHEGLKVFRIGDFLIGVSGSVRVGNLLRHRFDPPKPYPDDDLDAFMSTHFVDMMRNILRAGGALETNNGLESAWQGLLVATRGRIFRIDMDFSVSTVKTPWVAAGSGEAFALGSLWATSCLEGWTPQQRLENAVQAAIAMDVYCGGRAEIMCLPGKTEAA